MLTTRGITEHAKGKFLHADWQILEAFVIFTILLSLSACTLLKSDDHHCPNLNYLDDTWQYPELNH